MEMLEKDPACYRAGIPFKTALVHLTLRASALCTLIMDPDPTLHTSAASFPVVL